MLTFHWTYLLALAVILIIGYKISKIDTRGDYNFSGVYVIILALIGVVALAIIGGIWWW